MRTDTERRVNRRKGKTMKRETRLLLTLAIFGSFLSAGCVSHHRTVVVREPAAVVSGEVVVTTAPPRVRREVRTVSPSAAHVWVEGYWSHYEGRWVWNPGHWELRPRVGAVWISGHWDRTPRGWVWRPGHCG